MLKPKLVQQEQGFSLVEVMVSVVIAVMFVAVAMQMMVIAFIYKARAQEVAEATNWIQENLEDVKSAELTELTEPEVSSLCSAGSGFANALQEEIVDKDPFLISSTLTGTEYVENISRTSNLTKKEFLMKRTTILDTNVLQVKYEVIPNSGSSPIASFYTEVIPDAALQCP